MNKYTVFFTHDMPLGMGTAAHHLAYIKADSAELAAARCKGMLGGHATIWLVFEGYTKPIIEHEKVFTKAKFRVLAIKSREERERKHAEDPKNPAYFPLAGKPLEDLDIDDVEW